MNFFKFWPKRNAKDSFNKDLLSVDLFYQLTYMSAIATSGLTRSQIFEYASRLPYTSSRYFRDVHFLAQKLNYDYAQACRTVAEQTKEPEIKALLLRLSGCVASGEAEADFSPARLTSSGKYTAMNTNGAWNHYESGRMPTRPDTVGIADHRRLRGFHDDIPGRADLCFTHERPGADSNGARFLADVPGFPEGGQDPFPTRDIERAQAVLAPVQDFITVNGDCFPPFDVEGADMGWIMIAISATLFPTGIVIMCDDRKIDKQDSDIAGLLRSLGGVTKAIGRPSPKRWDGLISIRSFRSSSAPRGCVTASTRASSRTSAGRDLSPRPAVS
jgi:hypothetical protein